MKNILLEVKLDSLRGETMLDKSATYIVTGCTGYVGNVLTKKLLEEGCFVIGLARNEEKAKKAFKDNPPKIVYGDVTKKEDVERLFEGGGPFIVIHTVAKVSIGEDSFEELKKITVGGTENVVNCCLKYKAKKLLHVSTSETVIPGLKLKPDLSNLVPDPSKCKTKYAKAKSMADLVVLKAVKEHDLDASLLLPAGVLGPGDYSNSHMSQMMCDYVKGKLPASVKGGYNDFDIRDLADVLDKIIENSKKGESYIFANKPDQIEEVLEYVSKTTGAKRIKTLPLWVAYVGLPFLWIGSKLTGKRPLYTAAALYSIKSECDFPIEKVKEEFGYTPRPLEETVVDHINFLIDEGFLSLEK